MRSIIGNFHFASEKMKADLAEIRSAEKDMKTRWSSQLFTT